MTVTELAERMPSHEIAWWRAYFHVRHLEHEARNPKLTTAGGGTLDLAD